MSKFGADIGRIWRSDLDTASKAVLTAVRYHGDNDGNCVVGVDRIALISGCSKSTVLRRLADLVAARWMERIDRGPVVNGYRLTPVDGVPLVKSSKDEVSQGHLRSVSVTPHVAKMKCHPDTNEVSQGHLRSVSVTPPPTPPYKVFETSSRLSPDAGAREDSPTPAEYQALVDRVLDCYLVTARKPRPIQLGGVAADKLVRLVAVHGLHRVRLEIEECGGSEMPVDRLAARLARTAAATIAVEVYRPTAETPTPISPEGFAKLLEGTE